MGIKPLRRLVLELLRRQLAAFAGIVSGEIAAGDVQPPPDHLKRAFQTGAIVELR